MYIQRTGAMFQTAKLGRLLAFKVTQGYCY